MAKDRTTKTGSASFVDTAYQQMKADFEKRLNRGMASKGWRQSDLARHSGIGKDSISKYVNGVQVPERAYMERLAKALSMSPHELWPNYDGSATAPSLQQRIDRDPVDPNYAFVSVSVRIRYSVAQAVMQLIDREIADAANAG